MNYLQLCQRLVRETGIADSGPASVSGLTGDFKRVADWINGSWLKIQSMRKNWFWMWAQNSLTLTEGSSTISPVDTFERIEYMRVEGNLVEEISYEEFAEAYSTLPENKPSAFCIRPDGVVAFNGIADQDYSVTYDYFAQPTFLSQNSDVPALPERYRMIIVWDSLRQYALFDDAPELERKAVLYYEEMLADLQRDQLPEILAPEAIG